MIFRAIVVCTAGSLVMPTGAYKLKSEEKNYYFIIIFFYIIVVAKKQDSDDEQLDKV